MAPDKIEKLLHKARQAIEQRDWEKAKQVYLLALGYRSDLPDVHYGLATVYFHLRELTSAAHHFREVSRLDPLRAGALVNLGAVLNLLQQYDEAVIVLRRAIQLDPQRVEGYYNLGLVYRRKGQIELALQAYREALRLNPRMPDAHLNLANLHLEKQQYRQAVQHYHEALQLRPDWPKALEALAQAEEALKGGTSGAASARPPNGSSASTAPKASAAALDRTADPVVHGNLLTALHETTAGSEEVGQQFQQVLLQEVEPVIKELSTCLLYPDKARGELDGCIQRFEAALQHLRKAHESFQHRVQQLRQIAEHFPGA